MYAHQKNMLFSAPIVIKLENTHALLMQICDLLGFYTAWNGSLSPTFRDLQALSSRVKMDPVVCPETSVSLPLYDA
jgi:hypothetical protein